MNFNYNNKERMFWKRQQLSNGQTAMIGFQEDRGEYNGDNCYFSVIFAIADKKKQLNAYFFEDRTLSPINLKSTGKCGLEGLIWAVKQIEEFEIFIKKEYNNIEHIKIAIFGEDARRNQLYERYFKKKGYHKELLWNNWCMVKEV